MTALSGNGRYQADCEVVVSDKMVGDLNSDQMVDAKDEELLRKMIIGSAEKNDIADLNRD